jgi:hypothetical protein
VCVCQCVMMIPMCVCVCVCLCVCAAFKSRDQNGAMTECDNEWHTRETLNWNAASVTEACLVPIIRIIK